MGKFKESRLGKPIEESVCWRSYFFIWAFIVSR